MPFVSDGVTLTLKVVPDMSCCADMPKSRPDRSGAAPKFISAVRVIAICFV